jgi:hypothetical protein
MIIDLLHNPNLILKLYITLSFFGELFHLRVISLTTDKMVPDLARAMARTIIFSLFFSLFVDFGSL